MDHIGSVAALQEAHNCQVWISAQDYPYLMHELKRPGIKRLFSLIFRPQVPQTVQKLPDAAKVGGIQSIPAPGHTPGHTMFMFEDLLFVGDLFAHEKGKLKTMPSFGNWDHLQAQRRLALLETLQPRLLCPAHGSPIEYNDKVRDFVHNTLSQLPAE